MAHFTSKFKADLKISYPSGNEDPATLELRERLRRVLFELCNPPQSLLSKDCLVQIWICIEGASHKGTTLLAKDSIWGAATDEGLRQYEQYWKESSKNEIPKDMTIHISLLSDQANYLQPELAKTCGIQASIFFQVFDLQFGPSCIGLIEIVTTRQDPDFGVVEYIEIKRHLEKVGLKTSFQGKLPFPEEEGSSLAAQGLQDQPNLWERSTTEIKGRVNSDSQFHDHNGPNKHFAKTNHVCRKFSIGSPSSDKTPIVSARLENPRITRIFRFKSVFTIEALRRSIVNMFDGVGISGSNFYLYYVNVQNERNTNWIDRDEQVMELFSTNWKPHDSVVFVIDVVSHNVTGDVDLSDTENEGGRKLQGVRLDINDDGFKMAYEAIDNELTPSNRDKRMAKIIGASVSTVKTHFKRLYSSPIVIAPSTQHGFGNGEAARHKKMRIGESSSTLDILWPKMQLSAEQETQHSSGPSNMQVVIVGKTQDIMSEETAARGAEQQVQTLELDSGIARNMEVISRGNMPAETEQYRAGQQVPHNYYVEQMVENPSFINVEENEYPAGADADADAGIIGVENQFGNGNDRVFDATGEPECTMIQPSEANHKQLEEDYWDALGDIPMEIGGFDLWCILDEIPESDLDDNLGHG